MPKDQGSATTSAELRAHNLARLLRAVHEGGGRLTRAELTRQLSLARGTATVLVRDLAGRQLIEELASPADASVQSCVSESLRLISIGHAMLHHAFQVEGHEAYFNSAHGNWDLDLGINLLRACQGQLQTLK